MGFFLALVFYASQVNAAPKFNPEMAGGEGSVSASTPDAFSLPVRNISKENRKRFVVGNSFFKQNWIATPGSVKSAQGLGPIFNAQSCSSCHFKDGRGRPPEGDEKFLGLLLRLSVPTENGPVDEPTYGGQFQHRSILGVEAEGESLVVYQEIKGQYPDGTAYSLIKPTYRFEKLAYGPMSDKVMISPRVAPQVMGLGLIEAIAENEILKLADPEDKNKDGVLGRPNYVWDELSQSKKLGRFGWKANQPSLLQQNAGAFSGDIGITSFLFPKQPCTSVQKKCNEAPVGDQPEISKKDLEDMTLYTQLLAVPKRRGIADPNVQVGEKLFKAVNCVACHHPHFRTRKDFELAELRGQSIFPYSDFLLHDMGEGLADSRSDFDAGGRDWKTPPLWGLGLIKKVNGHTRLLHDGRARNVEEAILWHDGEAKSSKDKFMALSAQERGNLIEFVNSL